MTALNDLILAIKSMAGSKIVTVLTEMGETQFDINGNGTVGHGQGHEELWKAKLVHAMSCGGSVIVRQFQTDKISKTMPNGKRMEIPRKLVCGFYLGDNTWTPLSAPEMRLAYYTDAETGAALPDDPSVTPVSTGAMTKRRAA